MSSAASRGDTLRASALGRWPTDGPNKGEGAATEDRGGCVHGSDGVSPSPSDAPVLGDADGCGRKRRTALGSRGLC